MHSFSTHIQRKRIATCWRFFISFDSITFQPISSESGLRPRAGAGFGLLGLAFQPISSESGLRQPINIWFQILLFHFSTHIQRKRIATCTPFSRSAGWTLFNPYPAKADCDNISGSLSGITGAFQPISSESGLRLQRGRVARSALFAFQPISSESGLRQIGLWCGLV